MPKHKAELTVEAVTSIISEKKPTSLTAVSKLLGLGKGSVSGSVAKRLRGLLPTIDAMLAQNKGGDGKVKSMKAGKAPNGKRKAKPAAKPVAKAGGKWPHAEKSPFRPGSSYDTCYSILAAHKSGLPKEKLLALLAEATGKDIVHAGYDAQVLLSAHPNENGLSNNDSPRHRSCRPGFWVRRTNGHVQLMVD